MRYTMNDPGVPHAVGALMPTPAVMPVSSKGALVRIFGQPGTMGVPAPHPSAIPETAAGIRANQPSRCAPDVLFPSIYYTTPENMHPPVALLRDNEMPVPAVRVYNLPRVAMRGRRVGGQNQVGQPAVAQTWPEWMRR